MSDQLSTTGVSTGNETLATQTQGSTVTSPVNPAQSPLPHANQDFEGLKASYELRIRNLMSEKDKAINDRNETITQLSNLQKNYTTEKEQTQLSLNNTATAAQTAIDQSRQYEAQIKDLQGQLLRATMLLEKPHLAPYAQFIPANNDSEKMKALVEQLEVTRNQDLERSRSAGQFIPQTQQQGAPLLPGAGLPNSTLPTQVQQQQINPLSLYANRPGMNPALTTPGSSPAQMNPAGAGSVTDSIQQMLAEAMNSGDPTKYQSVLEQAKAIANANINSQVGR